MVYALMISANWQKKIALHCIKLFLVSHVHDGFGTLFLLWICRTMFVYKKVWLRLGKTKLAFLGGFGLHAITDKQVGVFGGLIFGRLQGGKGYI